MKLKVDIVLSAFAFLLWSNRAIGQFDQLKNYTVKDGLPSSQIYNILQDQKGFMWFAGDMGVSRFDGYEFKNFSTEDGLPNNSVLLIKEDYKGRIWFMTYTSELAYYFEGKVYVIGCNEKLRSFKTRGCIGISLYVDAGDTIWIGTSYLGLIKIRPGWKENDLTTLNMVPKGIFICSFNNKGFVYGGVKQGTHDSLQVSIFNATVFKYKLNLKLKFINTFKVEALPNDTWAVSVYEKIIHFNKAGIVSRTDEKDYINSLKWANQGVFVGTFSGLRFYKYGIFNGGYPTPRLENKSITDIVQDHEKGLWFSTDGQGVYYIPHSDIQYYSPEDGLSESKITCSTNLKSTVVLGHQNSMISVLQKNGIKSFKIKRGENSPFWKESIISLLPYNDHEFIVVTVHEIFRMNLNGKITSDTYVPASGAKKMVKGRNGYWLIGHNHISMLDSNFKKVREISISDYSDNLYEDRANNLWVCFMDGLRLFDSETGFKKMASVNSLFSSRVIDIVESKNGDLIMATRGSGVLVKCKDSTFTIGKFNGLTSNMCNSIYKESDDTIWVGTNRGLNRITGISKHKYKIRSFDISNGLLSYEVNTILKRDNKLWLIHNNGATLIDQANLTSNNKPPPIYLENVLINNDILKYSGLGNYFFSHNSSELEVNYIGLTYKNAGKTRYKYKLFGLDSNWTYTKNTNTKYQNLQPGSYRYSVYASNNDGLWSTLPANFSFVINKAWWQTWLFYILCGLIGVAGVSFIFRIRLRTLKKRADEEIARQRSIETSELKALRSQMNPHFIFNSLNSIQKFILMNDQDKAGNYLGKFSKLIRNILEQSGEKWISLEEELQTINLYLELESLRYNFKYTIHLGNDLDLNKTLVLPMIIQPYLENAIWHGLVHKEGSKKLEISITKIKDNILQFEIDDNGIGRARALELGTTNTPNHKSMGVQITQDRINLSNNSGAKKYTIEIIDKFEGATQSSGTKVILTLNESHY